MLCGRYKPKPANPKFRRQGGRSNEGNTAILVRTFRIFATRCKQEQQPVFLVLAVDNDSTVQNGRLK